MDYPLDSKYSTTLVHTSGTGSPENVVTGPPGSTYVREDSESQRFWRKKTGTGATGWETDYGYSTDKYETRSGTVVTTIDANGYATINFGFTWAATPYVVAVNGDVAAHGAYVVALLGSYTNTVQAAFRMSSAGGVIRLNWIAHGRIAS